jgi:hypothetical protein
VREWPPITEPELLRRLALDDESFIAQVRALSRIWGAREYRRETVEWALGYPFERPAASYLLRGADVELLADLDAATRASTVQAFIADRHPLLSYGGNAAPSWLAAKFAHFPDPADRAALVLTGWLEDFDVGPAASLAPTGYMPATLFASPGTRVRAGIVWATAAQVTQLTWSEIPYRLVRLDDAQFFVDDAEMEIDAVFGYLHRLGSFCIDGSPVALAAIPASNRTATALTQNELLDIAAGLVIGPDARAEELIRAIFEDMGAVTARASETVWPRSQQLRSRFTPFPAVREA